jgi:hypothetical protein
MRATYLIFLYFLAFNALKHEIHLIIIINSFPTSQKTPVSIKPSETTQLMLFGEAIPVHYENHIVACSNDREISNYTTAVTRQRLVNSNRGTMFSVRSVPRRCRQKLRVRTCARAGSSFLAQRGSSRVFCGRRKNRIQGVSSFKSCFSQLYCLS